VGTPPMGSIPGMAGPMMAAPGPGVMQGMVRPPFGMPG